jgi:hypothetical protein
MLFAVFLRRAMSTGNTQRMLANVLHRTYEAECGRGFLIGALGESQEWREALKERVYSRLWIASTPLLKAVGYKNPVDLDMLG